MKGNKDGQKGGCVPEGICVRGFGSLNEIAKVNESFIPWDERRKEKAIFGKELPDSPFRKSKQQ